jgi:hypothetical protein
MELPSITTCVVLVLLCGLKNENFPVSARLKSGANTAVVSMPLSVRLAGFTTARSAPALRAAAAVAVEGAATGESAAKLSEDVAASRVTADLGVTAAVFTFAVGEAATIVGENAVPAEEVTAEPRAGAVASGVAAKPSAGAVAAESHTGVVGGDVGATVGMAAIAAGEDAAAAGANAIMTGEVAIVV